LHGKSLKLSNKKKGIKNGGENKILLTGGRGIERKMMKA